LEKEIDVKHKCRKCGKVITNKEAEKIETSGMPSWYCLSCFKEMK